MYYLRNKIIELLYKWVAKPILFRCDPEKCHHAAIWLGKLCGKYAIGRWITRYFFNYQHPMLGQTIHGIHFPNPIGLAAGFDKNAELTDILPELGFGYAELGSVTGEPCAGNARPRVWRIPNKKALRINMGLNNDGAEAIAQRFKKSTKMPVGISIAKTNCPETVNIEAGITDYLKAYKHMSPIADYITINISCPNAFGGQDFRNPARLKKLLTAIGKPKKPLFLKLSPDMTKSEIDEILKLCDQFKVAGVICSNLTKKESKVGGISGKVIAQQSTEMISYIAQKTNGQLTIIGCGGIFTAEDAYEKLKAGASLLQLITGMIYEGPQVISEINRGLVRIMQKEKVSSMSEITTKKTDFML